MLAATDPLQVLLMAFSGLVNWSSDLRAAFLPPLRPPGAVDWPESAPDR